MQGFCLSWMEIKWVKLHKKFKYFKHYRRYWYKPNFQSRSIDDKKWKTVCVCPYSDWYRKERCMSMYFLFSTPGGMCFVRPLKLITCLTPHQEASLSVRPVLCDSYLKRLLSPTERRLLAFHRRYVTWYSWIVYAVGASAQPLQKVSHLNSSASITSTGCPNTERLVATARDPCSQPIQ